ncbi:MAG: S8 family serine peptidase [Phycisphaerales bacterium]|nr:S8 family serine peptidase [Phycisphaerales bacterium]
MRTPHDRVDGRSSHNGLESLESRVLLSGGDGLNENGAWDTEFINWGGANIEVVQDSWILAFHDRTTEAHAINRTQQVLAALGISSTSIDPFAGNQFARFESPANLTPQQANQLVAQFGFLASLGPNMIYYPTLAPNDPLINEVYAADNTGQVIAGTAGTPGADMSLFEAWNVTTGSRQIVVPIIDTGIDLNHPDLVDNLWTNPGEVPGNGIDDDGNGFIDDVNGYDFSGDNDSDPSDQQGHGTAVAGCVGAVGNNGIGVAGVNWEVSMIAVKIFPAQGGASSQDIIEGISYTTMLLSEFGVNIVSSSNSYGAVQAEDPNFNDNAETLAIQNFTDAGGIFVAAAGNDTNDNDGPAFNYPSSYQNEFIVAVAASNNLDELAGFSNFGLTSVDIAAPGERIMTTAMGGGYEFIDGTSFSCPYTAGVLALLASVNPFASKQALRDALYGGVDHPAAIEGRVVHGRVNVFESLRLIGFPGPVVAAINPGAVSGPVDTIQIQFSEALNPAFYSDAAIEIVRANGDGDFNANDIAVSFVSSFEPGNNVLTLLIPTGLLNVDHYRLTLRNQFFRDLDGNFLNGNTINGNDEQYEFQIVNGSGPFEPNDFIAQATPVIFGGSGIAAYNDLVIGDGNDSTRDVDLFRMNLSGPGMITVRVDARNLELPSTLDSYLRLFDSAGREIARNDNFAGLDSLLQIFVPAGGRYYLGVSGFGNHAYLPGAAGTGQVGGSTGTYNLVIDLDATSTESVTYASSTIVTIPVTGVASSSVFIPDIRNVVDVNITVNIDHDYIGDLQVRLLSPSGKSVDLILNRGGSGNDLTNTRFDDGGVLAIVAGLPPFSGTFRAEELLSQLSGDSAAGTWTLQVLDSVALNSGRILGWQLDLVLENAISGPFEVNDTILTSTNASFPGTRTYNAAIGDGAFGMRDVDMYRVVVDAGSTISANLLVPFTGANGAPNSLDSILRLFDQQGNQLLIDNRLDSASAFFSYPVQFSGIYYIGVSGASNDDYLAGAAGSGTSSDATGEYSLQLSIVGGISDGSVLLSGSRMTVGINPDGSFGLTGGTTPAGISLDGNEFLFSQGNTAEAFYGAIFNGYIFRNAGAAQSDLPVSVWNESDFSNRRIFLEGLFRSTVQTQDQSGGLLVRRAVSFGANENFMAIDVSVTNTTFTAMDGVGWVEGFKALQGFNLGSPFTRTVNDRDATGRLITASYTDADFPGGLTIGIGAPISTGPALYTSAEIPGTVRDPFQIIGSDVDPDGANSDRTLAIAYDMGSLSAGTTVNLRYFIFVGTSTAEVHALFDELNAGTGPANDHPHLVANREDASIAASDLPYALYYPEGFANDRASTFIPISNPNDYDTRVVILARYETGVTTQVLFDGIVGANSRGGITISTPQLYAANTQLVRKDTPFAVEVRSSLPVGATLSHFDFGISTGQAFTSTPSTLWTFGEGFKGVGVHDFLVFQNTSTEEIKVTLTVFLETSSQQFIFTQSLEGFRRGGWSLAELGLPNGPFAVMVEAEGPIVAALTHFDTNVGGGFGVLGLPNAGSVQGLVPEGQLGLNGTSEFVTILNANSSESEVTFTFFFANQSAFRTTIIVPAGRRGGFSVGDLPNFPDATQPYSIGYEATLPVSVTYASYGESGGSGSRFSDQAYSLWMFSDGFRPGSGNLVTEYLRLFNPTDTDMVVEISLSFAPNPAFGDVGGTETFHRTLAPRAAVDLNIHDFVTGERAFRDTFYSIRVKAPHPIVAFMGHIDENLGSGFGTLGTALGNTAGVL